jgi:transposase-like protein
MIFIILLPRVMKEGYLPPLNLVVRPIEIIGIGECVMRSQLKMKKENYHVRQCSVQNVNLLRAKRTVSASGKQSYKCKDCGCQYVENPVARKYPVEVKQLCLKMYLNGMGFREIALGY